MKILVTGGAGFIGSHLAEELLHTHEVCVLDDLSTGSIENIRHLKGREGFRYFIDTVLNRALVAELIDDAELILHLAAAVGVRLIVESPVQTIETNIKGTEIVLELAARKKKAVVIFSTSEVYGKSNEEKFSESGDLVLGPTFKGRWSYAASKMIDEFLALAYYKEKKLPVTIVRLFNTVGPRQTGRYGMVVPRFVRQALTGEPITVFGDGKQTRTFTHVKDAVWAILELLECSGAVGEIFNVGGKDEISIDQLAHRVKEALQSSSPVVYVPYAEAYEEGFEDMQRRLPDLRKISKLTGYTPKYDLEDIILDVAEYQRQRLANAKWTFGGRDQ
ncbi:MAG: nucleoside-diphosphate sugar epimerase [Candidatus Rokuibacteriota bacterium]|nr:MAG: nucleoside-diphosphate sugar epimerase [Candidatus Rokubacteria bacterium]